MITLNNFHFFAYFHNKKRNNLYFKKQMEYFLIFDKNRKYQQAYLQKFELTFKIKNYKF